VLVGREERKAWDHTKRKGCGVVDVAGWVFFSVDCTGLSVLPNKNQEA
jgi:hypothetical protein